MNYIQLFQLNNAEAIVYADSAVSCKWNCYGQKSLFLQQNDYYILLSEESVYENMLSLKDRLALCLRAELKLSLDGMQDLGVAYNNCLQNDSDATPYFIAVENIIGYCCWGSDQSITWLYNDQDGSIIFECCPIYNKKRDKKNYNKWLETYKPLVTRIITYQQAEKWLKETQSIIDYIDTYVFKQK